MFVYSLVFVFTSTCKLKHSTLKKTELQVTQHVGFIYLLSSKNIYVSYFIEIKLRGGESKLIINQLNNICFSMRHFYTKVILENSIINTTSSFEIYIPIQVWFTSTPFFYILINTKGNGNPSITNGSHCCGTWFLMCLFQGNMFSGNNVSDLLWSVQSFYLIIFVCGYIVKHYLSRVDWQDMITHFV